MDHIVHRVMRFDRFALDLARGSLGAGDRGRHARRQLGGSAFQAEVGNAMAGDGNVALSPP
jgi:hypothetical protein